MLISIFLALLLVLITFYVHFCALKTLSRMGLHSKVSNYNHVLIIVIILFAAHILEISLYAVTYEVAIKYFNIGSIHGNTISNFMEYLYYSIVMYTSLGLGDVYPVGHVRFISGVEALNGLLLIAWSASFTFLAMKRFWPWETTSFKENIK